MRDGNIYDHEMSMPVHNVFSRAIPGAFGIDFLRRLIAASPSKQSSAAENKAVEKSEQDDILQK